MGLLENLQKTSPKSSHVHDEPPGSSYKILRIYDWRIFDLLNLTEPVKFDAILESVDFSDIQTIQFSADLNKVAVVWIKELKKVDRLQHDEDLPLNNTQPQEGVQNGASTV